MTQPKQDRQSARRALRALLILQGHVMDGLRLSQVAEALGTSLPNALRDLGVLAEEGLAERIPGRDEYWRLTPKIVQISRATGEEFAKLRARVDEFEQRYSREPH
jgi:DNA-binding IclR family transcriptional regulator